MITNLVAKKRSASFGPVSGSADRGAWGLASLILLSVLMIASAGAATYALPPAGEGLVGQAFYVKSRHEDTLLDIARRHGLGIDEIQQANPGVDLWLPGEGADILIPAQHVLPDAPRRGIVLNLAEKRLYYFPKPQGDEPPQVITHPISIGREGWSTPVGSFHIVTKQKDPAWYPPASIRAEHEEKGDPLPTVVPPGPDNPLGQYALRLSARGYLIHGTNKPWGVGMEVSHGCIRMYPENIETLFPVVAKGTPVTIVDQPYKVGWYQGKLYLEVHVEDEEWRRDLLDSALDDAGRGGNAEVDWQAVQAAQLENIGLPRVVGGQRLEAGDHLYMIF